MAGHRRLPGPAADRPVVKSKAMVLRAERIREMARLRYAQAQTAKQRYVIAVNYVLSAEAAGLRAGVPDLADRMAEMSRDLMAFGDELTGALAKRGRGR